MFGFSDNGFSILKIFNRSRKRYHNYLWHVEDAVKLRNVLLRKPYELQWVNIIPEEDTERENVINEMKKLKLCEIEQ